METKKKILILPGGGWDVWPQFLGIILPPEKYDITVCKFASSFRRLPNGDSFLQESKVENTQVFLINFKKIRECMHLFVADIAILGVGCDWNNPARDGFMKDGYKGWSGNQFIDAIRKSCKFILCLDACRPNDNETFWDHPVTAKKNNHKHLLERCDAICSSYPHQDYPANATIWDYPIITEPDDNMIPYDDNEIIRAREKKITAEGKKIIGLFKSDRLSEAHRSITNNIINLVSELSDCTGVVWKYHQRLSNPIMIDEMVEENLILLKHINDKIKSLKLSNNQIGLIHGWGLHDHDIFFAINYSVAINTVEPYFFIPNIQNRETSEFISRASIRLVNLAIPIISQHYYYPSIFYPKLCITDNSQIIEKIQMGDDFLLEQVAVAQSIIKDYGVVKGRSSKDINAKKALHHFEDFFSEVL